MILVLAFLNAVLLSFDQPARGALVSVLVPREDLENAISLQAMIFNGASTLGPAFAGFGITRFGFAFNFFLNGASFLAVLVALWQMRVPNASTRAQPTAPAICIALATVRCDAVLPWVLSGYAALLFFAPSSALILPVYAVKILHVGPERLGLLFSAAGLGTVSGALFLAALGSSPRRGLIFLNGVFIWVAALAGFALSGQFWISMTALFVFGIGQTLVGTATITLLQTRVLPYMRGRMMSVNTLLVMGIRPFGDFPAGALIGCIGAPATILLSTSFVGLYGLWLAMRSAIRSA
jgi:MFS family permease